MSFIDIIVLLVLFASLIFGFFRGFVKELLSLMAWVFAFFVAYYFSSSVAIFLPFEAEFSIKYVGSFVLIFIFVLIVSSILIKFMNKKIILRS